ncbi:MAG: 50S ribosomal protein L3 [Clostridiales bacterium]|nr:50S ribosomal protein L3 [Clostridiales bacterium]
MNKAIIGKKLGMTQVFQSDGTMVPVTVIQAGPCAVTQVKTVERDGYAAVQLGFEEVPERKLNKPELGHLKAAGVKVKHLHEFKLEGSTLAVGDKVSCDVFAAGEFVDVTGVTKGHGFTGVIKRWNQHRLKETHGVGPVHREVGSMGPISSPSRVMPGKNLPGQYGVEQVTVLNLSVVKVDKELGVILVKGAVPGAKNSIVYVRNAVKK